MTSLPFAVRAGIRLLEALALSLLAGLLVWTLGRLFVRVPLLSPALLGFLSGGAATLGTLGVVVRSRRRRMLLAVLCALAASSVSAGLEYGRFVRDQRRRQTAADFRTDAIEADRRTGSELAIKTGHGGPLGYGLVALDEGLWVVPGWLRLRGPWLLGFWLIDLAVAAGVAARWAGGPRPGARPEPGA